MNSSLSYTNGPLNLVPCPRLKPPFECLVFVSARPPPSKFSPPGGKTATQKDGSDVQLHQMTSSAVGNIPEKDVDGIKASVLRGIMHADETFFSFKVWLWVA